MAKKDSTDMNNYVLYIANVAENSVFKGHRPRQAALKAANRYGGTKEKPVIIKLRQRGTRKLHVFKAWKEMVPAPKNKPAWMPDMIWKPFVEKVEIERI